MSFWTGKVVVVTGSSIGIGRATAELAAKQGAKVVLNARNADRLQDAVRTFHQNGYEAIGCPGDVSVFEDAVRLNSEAIKAFGKVDVVICNAGVSHETRFDELKPEVFQSVLKVNVFGCSNVAFACKESLEQTAGSLIFIGSVAGFYGMGTYSAYCTSKMALTSLAQSLQIEWKSKGVHVGIAYLGMTQNDPQKEIFDAFGNTIPQPKRKVTQQPVGVVATGILSIAERRASKKVFSSLGKLSYFISRWIPSVSKSFFTKLYKKAPTNQ